MLEELYSLVSKLQLKIATRVKHALIQPSPCIEAPSETDAKESNSKKLSKLEKEVLIRHILELDTRGIPATKVIVQEMAYDLLAERGREPVGKHWVDHFKTRTPEIKLRKSRPYDRQRALNEDLRAIKPFFELVSVTKAKYGITDENMYNFDETGFMMGVIHDQMLCTGSENRSTKNLRPGKHSRLTNIQGRCNDGRHEIVLMLSGFSSV